MPDAPTLALALIARDEEASLPALLQSIEGAFDEVVLADTGSKDNTVALFEDWAQQQIGEGKLRSYRTGRFEWRHDFAAARNYADSLVSEWVEFTCWADADDVVAGAQNLRAVAGEMAQTGAVAAVAAYDYAQDEHGRCVCTLKRERLVRRGATSWQGRVHEAQLFDGPATWIPPTVCEWRHRKQHQPPKRGSNERNLRILRGWLKDEPQNPRVLGYLGTEEMVRGRLRKAKGYFRRYLKLRTGWDEERAQVHRKLAQCLLAEGHHDDAIGLALEALRLLPTWPDSHLTLAEAHYHLQEFAKAEHWAREVMRLGMPDTLLIVNPQDYAVQPQVLLAGALGAQGRLDEAIDTAEQALALAPNHGPLLDGLGNWRSQRKRESTARTVVGLADVLVAHDEQLRALAVLENAPHFAIDHPLVVQKRSEIRERLAFIRDPQAYSDHYEFGGSKPEDAVEDWEAVGDALPRCAFLLEGLREQAGLVAA